MDPTFIMLMSGMAESSRINGMARSLAEENERRRRFDEVSTNLLKFIDEEGDRLMHDSSANPKKAYIESRVYLYNLEYYNIIPDLFPEQMDKENVILKWRKLMGIEEKCQARLTPSEMEECQQCLKAFWMRGFIIEISERLGEYQEFLEIKQGLEQKRAQQFVLRKKWFAGFAVVSLAAIFILFRYTLLFQKDTAGFVAFVLVENALIVFLIDRWFRGMVNVIDRQVREHAGNEDNEFWTRVKEEFSQIPTEEMLVQRMEEETRIIQAVLGEDGSEPV